MALSKDNKQISVTLPLKVIEILDKDAEYNIRTRSQQAAKIIIDYYKNKEK